MTNETRNDRGNGRRAEQKGVERLVGAAAIAAFATALVIFDEGAAAPEQPSPAPAEETFAAEIPLRPAPIRVELPAEIEADAVSEPLRFDVEPPRPPELSAPAIDRPERGRLLERLTRRPAPIEVAAPRVPDYRPREDLAPSKLRRPPPLDPPGFEWRGYNPYEGWPIGRPDPDPAQADTALDRGIQRYRYRLLRNSTGAYYYRLHGRSRGEARKTDER